MYSKGDVKTDPAAQVIHIEGDIDHPTNRGTLCPKGAALKDFIHAPTRLTQPMRRAPGGDRFGTDHLGGRARQDRPGAEGRPRRQPRHSQRRGRAGQPLDDHRLPRRFRNHERDRLGDREGHQGVRRRRIRQPGARLTRPHGVQFGPDIWPWSDDQLLDRHQEHRPRRRDGRQAAAERIPAASSGCRAEAHRGGRPAGRGRPGPSPGNGFRSPTSMRQFGRAATSPG